METNARGIPKAPFVEDVAAYISKGDTVEITLNKFQEAIAKYKFMQVNMLQRKKNLSEKIPEIQKTLDMVSFLSSRTEESFDTQFELNDTLYAKANIDAPQSVYLWLGANVMLEYPLDEASTLLSGKLTTATKSLTSVEEDLLFLQEQITIMEVNVARVYNFDVRQRKSLREAEEKE